MKTMALTGGTGFVGRRVIAQAVGSGWHVRALTRRFFAPPLTVKEPGNLTMPSYEPKHAWFAGGQLPVTVTEVHPQQQPTLRWAHLPWNLDRLPPSVSRSR